jgi:hypothetical protein
MYISELTTLCLYQIVKDVQDNWTQLLNFFASKNLLFDISRKFSTEQSYVFIEHSVLCANIENKMLGRKSLLIVSSWTIHYRLSRRNAL